MILLRDDLRMAFVAIPKVASGALRGSFQGRHAIEIPHGYVVTAVIRHPWDRLVSAMFSVLRSQGDVDERIALFMQGDIDSHIRPQVRFLPERVDHLIRYEHLATEWPELGFPALQRVNVGNYRPVDWRDAPIDYGRWLSFYEQDFALCPDWQY